MGKAKAPRRLADNEARAVLRTIRVSPQKLNLVAALIRGKKVQTALSDLEFSRKRIAGTVKKTLESAIANAENNHDLDVDALVVSGEIRLMAAVDRVDGVIYGPLHHREVQFRDLWRLTCTGNRRVGCVDQRVHGVKIPDSYHTGALRRRHRGSGRNLWCDERDERHKSGEKDAEARPLVEAVSEHVGLPL